MSGVYWGIVTGLLSMIVLLFVCMEILSRGKPRAAGLDDRQGEGQAEKMGEQGVIKDGAVGGSKHAA
jgi:hypothetical protein